jgi:endonuclease III
MKQGTAYAKRIRQLHHELLKQHGKPPPVDPGDPIEQLLISILATDCTDSKAVAAYTKLRQQMVDLNEMRVTPAIELEEMFASSLPDAEDKARRIVSVLNDIRRRQDTLDLSFLAQRGRREARDYLESLEGADRFAAARVVLLCLGGHAIPVANLTLYVLRKKSW